MYTDLMFYVRAISVDMFVGIGLEAHDKNNNYSADRKNDETACGHFFIIADAGKIAAVQ